MHTKRATFFTIFIMLVSSALFAQPGAGDPSKKGSVSGKLTDAKNNPVSYATVTLLRSDSSVVNGGLSLDDGSFAISPTGLGNFILRFESIGITTRYENVSITADALNKNIGTVKLAATENKLKEVSVVGEKPIMELKVDKKVFNVEKNTTTAGGSASDVLQNVPAVSVDVDGTVSLRGKSGVTILIDGKPATLLGSDVNSALQSLPASSIESVEVITNPSAKYDAQGTSGILNIITKKDGRLGINGTATLGAGTRDKYNGNLGLNVRKGKWNVFMNSSGRINNTYNNVFTDRHDKMHDSSYHTYEHVPRRFGGSFNTIGASFDPDKYNSITVTENINRMGFSFKDYSDYNIYNNQDFSGAPVFTQNRYTDFGVNIFSVSSAIDYKHKFKKKDEELSIDGTYSLNNFTRHQYYVTDNVGDPSPLGHRTENSPAEGANSTVTVWADYTDPLFTKNGKLGAGFKSTMYNFHNSNDPLITFGNDSTAIDYNLLSRYNYDQQTHAAYLNWNDQIGKFSYQVGLRVEDAIYEGTGQLPDSGPPKDTSFKSSFLNPFPSAFISYQLGKQQSIYLNYSRRTNYPGFMQLLPFIDLSNPGTINTGNPALIPEFIHNVEFSYSKSDNKGNNFILSTYFARTNNLIEKITTPIDTTLARKYNILPSSLYSRPVNIASGTTYGLEGTGHLQFTRIWDATVNLNFFQNELVIGNGDTTFTKYLSNNNGYAWFGKVNTNLKLPKNFSLQVNANYESPKVIAQGHLKETYWVDVALRKNFWKNKATLVLNCSDIFKTHVFVTNYDLVPYSQVTNRVKETRIGNITFTYRFGKSDPGKNFAMGNGGKRGKGSDSDAKPKPVKPSGEDREKNMKEGDDDNQGGGGQGGQGGGGMGGPKKDGGGGGRN